MVKKIILVFSLAFFVIQPLCGMDEIALVNHEEQKLLISFIEASLQRTLIVSEDRQVHCKDCFSQEPLEISFDQMRNLTNKARVLYKKIPGEVTLSQKLSLLGTSEFNKDFHEDMSEFSAEEIFALQLQRMKYFYEELPNINNKEALVNELVNFKKKNEAQFKEMFAKRNPVAVAYSLIEWNKIIHAPVNIKQTDCCDKIHKYMEMLKWFPIKPLAQELSSLSHQTISEQPEVEVHSCIMKTLVCEGM